CPGLPKSLRWRDFATAQTLMAHDSLHNPKLSKLKNVESSRYDQISEGCAKMVPPEAGSGWARPYILSGTLIPINPIAFLITFDVSWQSCKRSCFFSSVSAFNTL